MTVLDFGPIYTPTGAITQLEYAHKATLSANTALGIATAEGVLLLTEIPLHTLYDTSREAPIETLGKIGVVGAGMHNDMVTVCGYVRRHLRIVGRVRAVRAAVVADGVRRVLGAFTRHMGMRPVGCAMLVGVWGGESKRIVGGDCSGNNNCNNGKMSSNNNTNNNTNNINTNNNTLLVTDCTGRVYPARAAAIGRGSPRATTELENLSYPLTLTEATDNAVRILYRCYDPLRDKPFDVRAVVVNEEGVVDVDVRQWVEMYKDMNVDDE